MFTQSLKDTHALTMYKTFLKMKIMTIIILAKECYCKYLCSDILALATRKHKHRPDHMTVNIIY